MLHSWSFEKIGRVAVALVLVCASFGPLVPVAAIAAELSPVDSSYVLGSGDQVTIRVLHADEVPDKPFRIDEEGNLELPMVGSVRATGLTVHALAGLLTEKFRAYIKHPEVSVFVTEMQSQPVSVLGAVNAPGIHQLQGHKSLLEMLALAGGVRNDAGYRVRITRRAQWGAVPVPGATSDADGRVSVAEIPLKSLMEAGHPSENIAILPGDVITVPVGELVYVMGEVKKPGGFVLGDRREVTALQAVAMADGMLPSASRGHAEILRTPPGATTGAPVTQIPVDLKKILSGKAPDVALRPTDILYIPGDGARRAAQRTIDSLIAIGTASAIYRP